ncbi:7-deoxyloganetin glucosyltransferase-like [Pistacia vera]|uniref:7-deoxyloganetin glucosyltransferase-like n=1 Tax=Pistacia vera TaxID=55513 RepID=UPI0012632D16|nr:7-deoxyloganetin glucosyltransferase-like [Pistacia vera]
MSNHSIAKRPHAVCIPFPAQGHMNPMLKLAKIMYSKGSLITFINTEYNHKRLLKSKCLDSFKNFPGFRFETIPDGLPSSDADVTQDIPSLCEATSKHCLAPFRELFYKLNDTSSSSQISPVTCIISDVMMSFTVNVAREFGIPGAILFTFSACGSLCFAMLKLLVERGLIPLKDESYLTNGYLDTKLDCIPGMKNMRLRDFPNYIRTINPNDFMVSFAIKSFENLSASSIIFNTFDALEQDVLDVFSTLLPIPIYTIGPLQFLADRLITNEELKNTDSNLWKYQSECIEWLDSKETNSVIYVNFGSIVVMNPEQLIELAWGLANSKQHFLWIIRPDLVAGDSSILPPEFLEETKGRGMIASWCPQEKVLKHFSIGGFLSHMGWNSTLESLSIGVPMVCWPFIADQQPNCRFTCTEWGVGMEINGDNVKREEVEMLVRVLMEGEKGKQMKKRAMEWKTKAEEAIRPDGSSYKNLEKLFSDIL